MEDFKKMFDGVYGWYVENGKPKPPKQVLPQAVKDRVDYFWEMAEDGLTLLGAMECIFAYKKPEYYDWFTDKRWLPRSKEFDDWTDQSLSMAQFVIAVYLIYGGSR